jgi:hypothetical protein
MNVFTKSTIVAALVWVCVGFGAAAIAADGEFTDTFNLDKCKLKDKGENDFFMLKPGYGLLLQGEEDGETVVVLITVLKDTKVVDGVKCRVVREKEWVDDELVEISLNYFAFCKEHKGVFYFGEDVDIYEEGEVVSHDGAWLAGVNGAKAGLIMPGYALAGSRYYQEVAPGVAQDRAEHITTKATVETPAGTFQNCLKVEETTPLDSEELSVKYYARGVGLVEDDGLQLVEYGFKVTYEGDNGE